MANVQITQLPNANPLVGNEQVPIVQSGITVKTTTGAIAAASGPLLNAEFVLVNYDPTLPNSRYLSTTLPIDYTDNGAGSDFVISLRNSTVTPGSYTNANITVNSKGLITAASNGTSNYVSLINTGLGLTGGPITSSGTISIDPTVTATLTNTQTFTNKTISGANNTLTNIGNSSLTNNSVTYNGVTVALGSSGTITATNPFSLSTGTGLTGGPYNGSAAVTIAIDSTVATVTGAQSFTNKTINASLNTLTNIGNSSLTNSTITINGTSVSLGGTDTITATVANPLTIGTGLSGTSFDGSSPVTIAIDSTVVTLTGSQTLTGKSISGSTNTFTNIPNSGLANSSITINGSPVSLGGSITVTASIDTLTIGTGLTGTSFNGSAPVTIAIDSTVATLTGIQTLTNKTISGNDNTLSNIANSSLTNSAVTFNGTTVSLGSSGTITAANPNALTIGTGLTGTSYTGASAVTIAIDSTVVTLTGTQTLDNKTLTTPIVNTSLRLNGPGVTSYTPFADTMASFVADDNNYKLLYIQNKNNGSTASADFVAYNDASDVDSYFVDMGIVSSNYTDVTNTVFPANSGYVYTGGGSSGQASALLLGTSNAASDLIMFTGGTLLADTRMTIKGNTGNVLINTSTDNGYKFAVNGTTNFTGAALFGSTVTLNADPTLALQAATKQYVDNQVTAGIHIHEPVLVETTGNLNAAYTQGGTTFNITAITGTNTVTTSVNHGLSVNDQIWLYNTAGNGLVINTAYFVDSIPAPNQLTLSLTFGGAQITGLTNAAGLTYNTRANSGVGSLLTNAGAQVALVIDNVAMTVGDRVMVRLQTTGYENGVYEVTDIGSISTNWELERAADSNQVNPADVNGVGTGDYYFTRDGDLNAGDSHVLTTAPNTMILGYTTLTYTQFSGGVVYVGAAPISVTGQTISLTGTVAATNGGTGTNTVTTGDLLYGSATNTWSKLPLGVAYKSLIINASGTQVEWNAIPLNQAAAVSGQLGVSNGGTGVTTSTGSGAVVLNVRPTLTVTGSEFTLQDATDNTKQANFVLSGITTATTRAYTLPNLTGTLATLGNLTQTFSGNTTFALALTSNGNVDLCTSGTTNTQINRASTTGTVAIGGPSQTGTITVGQSTVSQTTNIQAGATASGSTKTVNIGTGGLTGSTTTMVIGSTFGTSVTANGSWTFGTTISGSISGNAATATTATTATSAITATNLDGGAANSLPYQTGSGATSFISIGSNNQVLTVVAGVPTWQTPGAGTSVTTFSAGTTGFTPNTATSGAVTLAGTLNVANGGTGTTTLTGLVYGNGTSAFTVATASDIVTAIGTTAVTNATNATNATNTTNTGITNDTTTNATVYPTWVTANTGNLPQRVTSTKLTFNPSTGVLTSTGGISGGSF
jgi:hypothetical protein